MGSCIQSCMAQRYLCLLVSRSDTTFCARSHEKLAKMMLEAKGTSLDGSQGIPKGLVNWLMSSKL